MAIDALARGMAAAAGGGGGGLDVGIDAGTGIRFNGTDPITIINTGVTAVTTPGDNDIAEDGTIKVANPGAENSADRVHYVKVKGINNAAFKDVDTVINDTKATSTNVPTTKAVYDELEKKLEADLDTTAFTNDNDHVPSSKLVKEKLDDKLEDSLTINDVSYNSNTDSYTLDGDDIDLTGYTPISSGSEEDVAATDSVNDGIAKVEYKADNRIPTANIDTDFPVSPDATHVLASTVASAEFKGTGTAGVNPKKGLVPAPGTISGTETRFLKADGTWATPPNAEYSAGTGINISNTGEISNTGVTDVSASNVADPSIANGTFKVVENGTEKYIPIKGLDDAAYKDVDNAITSGSTSTNLPTTQAVADYVDDAVSDIDATDINLTSNYAPASTASLPAASDPVQTAIGKLAKSVDANQNSISLLGADISFTINSSTYELTARLLNSEGDAIGTAKTVDLPLESMVVDADYDDTNKTIVLTLKNGQTTSFSVADLVSGLQSELNANNKLNPAFIDYDASHRAVSDTEKGTWNGKQDVISDLATIRSGAAAGATAVQPSEMATALAGKQDTISDLEAIRSGASAGATAVQPATMATALAGKQDSLDQTQLAAVNSGINSTKVGQIETNKENILYVADRAGKNVLRIRELYDTGYSVTIKGITYTVQDDYSIKVNGTCTAATGDSSTLGITQSNTDETFGQDISGFVLSGCPDLSGNLFMAVESRSAPYTEYAKDTGSGDTIDIIPSGVGVIVFIRVPSGKTINNAVVYPMIRPAFTDSAYQPPSLPNHDLTRLEAEDRAALAEVVDSGAKNKLWYDLASLKANNSDAYWTWNGNVATHTTGVSVTVNSDMSLSISGNPTGGAFIFTLAYYNLTTQYAGMLLSGCPTGGNYQSGYALYVTTSGDTTFAYDTGDGVVINNTGINAVRILGRANAATNGKVFKPMICNLADWKVSQKYVPYQWETNDITNQYTGSSTWTYFDKDNTTCKLYRNPQTHCCIATINTITKAEFPINVSVAIGSSQILTTYRPKATASAVMFFGNSLLVLSKNAINEALALTAITSPVPSGTAIEFQVEWHYV